MSDSSVCIATVFLVFAQMSKASNPVISLIRPNELLMTKCMPEHVALPTKISDRDICSLTLDRLDNNDILCDHITKWYADRGINQFTVNTLSTVDDIIYNNACKGWSFADEPLVLTGLYHVSIKRDIFKAILFAIDNDVISLTVHLLSKDTKTRKRCEDIVTGFANMCARSLTPGMVYANSMDSIVDYFNIGDRPYIPREFCHWLSNVRLNIIDIVVRDDS